MLPWVGSVVDDLRFALRSWRRSPGFALSAIATLAIGIGANAAIFSVVSGVLLRPLPYAEPQNLVQLYETQPRTSTQTGFDGPVVYQDFEQWRTQSRLIEGMITYISSSANYLGDREPEKVATVAAERGVFRLLGVPAIAGRTFGEGDPLNVAVVSYGFWTAYLRGDRSAIGRRIVIDGQPRTVIGVMPEGFRFPYSVPAQVLWIPWEVPAELRSHPTRRVDSVVARLKSGIALEEARQELNGMESAARGRRVVRIKPLKDVMTGAVRKSLLVLLGAAGLVLLIACVNVANLMMARTASRVREIAIRAAVGAEGGRLMRQFLTESLLMAAAGGVAGLVFGMFGSQLLLRLAAPQIPRAEEIGLDWRVFAFLLGVCVITGIGFGVGPGLAAARGVVAGLATRNVGSRLRDALVVVEVALAAVLLIGAGLLLRTFLNLQSTDPGLQARNVLTIHLVVRDARDSSEIVERVAEVPGVRAVGMISLLPLQESGWNAVFTIAGRPEVHECELRYVTPGYFRAMGIPLRRGRELSRGDDATSQRVILVNEALARLYFPGEDPVGRSTNRGVIVGVVGDVRQTALGVAARPEIYYSVAQNFAQMARIGSTLVVRSSGRPETMVGAVRAAVREVRPDEAPFRVVTMEGVIAESLASPRLYAWLLGLFAATGTLLAVSGIYGVIAYLVTLRTREFGIRMALGADTGRIVRLVLKRGVVLIAMGIAMGIAAASVVTRVLLGLLYGVTATDPATLSLAAAALVAAAIMGCLVPARRAARVEPSIALRCE